MNINQVKIDRIPRNANDFVDKTMFVYVLKDPRNDKIKYVGQTEDWPGRLRQHLQTPKKYLHLPKYQWVQELKNLGIIFSVEILNYCTSSSMLNEYEIFWIKHFNDSGCDLFNRTRGGRGIHGCRRSAPIREFSDQFGTIYKNVPEAGRILKISDGNIRWCLNNTISQTHGFGFCYLDQLPENFVDHKFRVSREHTSATAIKISASLGGSPFIDQNGVRYDTQGDAARRLGVSIGSISHCLNGKKKQIRGYSFTKITSHKKEE